MKERSKDKTKKKPQIQRAITKGAPLRNACTTSMRITDENRRILNMIRTEIEDVFETEMRELNIKYLSLNDALIEVLHESSYRRIMGYVLFDTDSKYAQIQKHLRETTNVLKEA